ncbi:transcription initiation factor TFIID 23-30kDa subunit-domain-containing protein [Triangularia verruculosa]|uniref:Transcription initiation factor TFIID 23-30kDa subunit-domain-containing protein n=1 Tax=Triangularia verruculosa TaxID=2587418 RepID=A0AAN6XE79_9PEZI|nr:transcription initiation factor TFIID 23-30kDa subunit-domain-containing protein [Triangularia verruculosa]
MATGTQPTENPDQSVSASALPNGTQPPAANATTAGEAGVGALDGGPVVPPLPEAKTPLRKDASLKEFLNKMDDYAPIIPDAVTNYYMTRAGLPPPPQTDQRLARLLALATQKFIADIAADAYQYSRIRASNTSANNPMGNLGAAAGFPIPGQPANQPGAKDQGRGGPLGIQRPGYGGGGQGSQQNRTVLTMEDLGMAVGEFGVNVKRSEFYR